MTTGEQWIEQAPPDVRRRFEFFEGSWHKKPVAGLLHQDHVFLITAELKRRGLRAYFDVVTHLPEVDERTGKRVEVHPDVLVIAAGDPDQGGDGEYDGVPDLVVEVAATPSAEGYDASKRPTYERNGVRHYWLVRLQWMTLEASELGADGQYYAAGAGDLLPWEALPVPEGLR
jgi:Uma2 family endonuclease